MQANYVLSTILSCHSRICLNQPIDIRAYNVGKMSVIGRRFIVTLNDYYFKFPEFVLMDKITSTAIIRWLECTLVYILGMEIHKNWFLTMALNSLVWRSVRLHCERCELRSARDADVMRPFCLHTFLVASAYLYAANLLLIKRAIPSFTNSIYKLQ